MNLNEYIESTNLSQTSTINDIIKLCDEAIKYHFPCVVVAPYYVKSVKDYLKDSTVQVATVVGFPNGYSTREVKQFEAINACEAGADEIDMVININALKNKDYDYVKDEIELIRDSIGGKVLKVIIEVGLLTEEEIIKMTKICNETFVHFLKTSTGFLKKDKTISEKLKDIDLVNENKNEVLEIKVSGGIKTQTDVSNCLKHGVSRIGTSHASLIMEEK